MKAGLKAGWLGLVCALVACGNASSDDDDAMNGAGGAAGGADVGAVAGRGGAGATAGSGDSNGGGGAVATAGASTGGSAAGTANGGSAGTTNGGMGAGAGAAGAGGQSSAACNELELIATAPTCAVASDELTPEGGDIVAGVYSLVSYRAPICFAGFQQTVRISSNGANVYQLETVVQPGNLRASSDFVRNGAQLSATSTCGGSERTAAYGYSAYTDQGVAHLALSRLGQGIFVYRRAGAP